MSMSVRQLKAEIHDLELIIHEKNKAIQGLEKRLAKSESNLKAARASAKARKSGADRKTASHVPGADRLADKGVQTLGWAQTQLLDDMFDDSLVVRPVDSFQQLHQLSGSMSELSLGSIDSPRKEENAQYNSKAQDNRRGQSLGGARQERAELLSRLKLPPSPRGPGVGASDAAPSRGRRSVAEAPALKKGNGRPGQGRVKRRDRDMRGLSERLQQHTRSSLPKAGTWSGSDGESPRKPPLVGRKMPWEEVIQVCAPIQPSPTPREGGKWIKLTISSPSSCLGAEDHQAGRRHPDGMGWVVDPKRVNFLLQLSIDTSMRPL